MSKPVRHPGHGPECPAKHYLKLSLNPHRTCTRKTPERNLALARKAPLTIPELLATDIPLRVRDLDTVFIEIPAATVGAKDIGIIKTALPGLQRRIPDPIGKWTIIPRNGPNRRAYTCL